MLILKATPLHTTLYIDYEFCLNSDGRAFGQYLRPLDSKLLSLVVG
jgi:hypothetical protein